MLNFHKMDINAISFTIAEQSWTCVGIEAKLKPRNSLNSGARTYSQLV